MRKIKSILIYLYFITICLLFIAGCSKNNPITPDPIDSTYLYDSPRFNWRVDTLFGEGFIAGLWARDTNDVYITNPFTNRLYRIADGMKTITQYPNEIVLGTVVGDEMNNGYLIGTKLIGTIYQPFLQKFDGNNFVDINNPQNLDRNFFYWSAYIKNASEMWFGLTDGTVVKFNGINFTQYSIGNTNLVITKFFYDESNRLNFLAYDPHYGKNYTEYLVYELNNNQWERTYRHDVNSTLGPIRYDIIGKKIAPFGLFEIYELLDSTPIPRIHIPVSVFHLALAGTSYNNVLIGGFKKFIGCNASLFHWNGNRWSAELCNYDASNSVEILTINENYFYAIMYDMVLNQTFIIRGTKNIN